MRRDVADDSAGDRCGFLRRFSGGIDPQLSVYFRCDHVGPVRSGTSSAVKYSQRLDRIEEHRTAPFDGGDRVAVAKEDRRRHGSLSAKDSEEHVFTVNRAIQQPVLNE
jgi:hypothetical protein